MRAVKIAGLALHGLRRSPLRVTLTTLGVTFASGALVTMVALAVGIQRQVETPFRALALLNNIQVKPREGKEGAKAPPLDDAALAKIEKIRGVTMAYPDVHVKGIKVQYGKKEAVAIGVALPREASLLGVADEFIIAGRLFEQGTEPETIVGLQIVNELGFRTPQEAIGKQITIEASGLARAKGVEAELLAQAAGVKKMLESFEGLTAEQVQMVRTKWIIEALPGMIKEAGDAGEKIMSKVTLPIAAALGSIDNITVYDSGTGGADGASGLERYAKIAPQAIMQAFMSLKETGALPLVLAALKRAGVDVSPLHEDLTPSEK